jgi:uncharacterized repeat protein (TIGR01451 family)
MLQLILVTILQLKGTSMLKKLVSLLMILGSFIHADTPVSGVNFSQAVYQEREIINSASQKSKKYIPVQTAQRGSELVYVNSIINKSDIARKKLVVDNPIPFGVRYVAGSASCQGSCEILFSIDGGKSFKKGEELYVIFGTAKRLAKESEYTHIKYIFPLIQPHSQTRMAFKGIVQ